ncbi:hypothetical protein KIW84_034869 [Lathyrus oleraceus]|uniref:Phosphoglycerate mutase n=1 Tax=Pisum sativum TaxID=3888 RepID=A0A9D4Y3V4_PEA|nr:hypothetical protein KIW84_034869 [Pisum sativum]
MEILVLVYHSLKPCSQMEAWIITTKWYTKRYYHFHLNFIIINFLKDKYGCKTRDTNLSQTRWINLCSCAKEIRFIKINIGTDQILFFFNKPQLPKWEESVTQAKVRYQETITNLADKYPTENLLLVTHGEGTQVALSSFTKDVVEHKVKYCGYVQLRRPIFVNNHSFIGGKLNLQTHIGQNGVTYISSQDI